MRFPALILALVISPQWQPENSGTKASLRAIHAVFNTIAWAGGTAGTLLHSHNGVWETCTTPPGADKLDFRGIWAWNSLRAIAMSSGPGDSSRLYLTDDSCQHWKLLASNQDKDGFWDALIFASAKTGYLLGDPVNGRFVVMNTDDGGASWHRDESDALQASVAGEGAFAASNSSLAVTSDGAVFFGTGGKTGARIFHKRAGHWTATSVPLGGHAETTGVFSISFRGAMHGVAVGGDFKHPEDGTHAAIWTIDGGISWHAAQTAPGGYRSSVAWSPKLNAWVAVGPNGADISRNDGVTWQWLDHGNWNALSLPWVCGPNGRIATLSLAP